MSKECRPMQAVYPDSFRYSPAFCLMAGSNWQINLTKSNHIYISNYIFMMTYKTKDIFTTFEIENESHLFLT